jgi:hypothetical protein
MKKTKQTHELFPFKLRRDYAKDFPRNFSTAIVPTEAERLEASALVPNPTGSNEELASLAERTLGELIGRSRNGDGKALWYFTVLANRAAGVVSEIARTNPKVLQPVARQRELWPIMKSTNPKLSDPDSVLKAIDLFGGVPIQMDEHSKWKPDDASGIAVALYQHIETLREENPIIQVNEEKPKRFKNVLPPFSKQTCEQWWKVAKYFLLAAYPSPEREPELIKIIPPSQRKTPGRTKQAILEKIRARFFAFAKHT